MNPLDEMPPAVNVRQIPTGDPLLDLVVSVDCPTCGAKALSWCPLRGGATWSYCGSRRFYAEARRDLQRRINAADSLLFVAIQSCIEPDVRLKLIHESRAALRGEYPDWWTDDDHVRLEQDAERHRAWLAELAANQKVVING